MKEIEIKGLNEIVYTTTLDNGLKVHMWVKDNVHSFYSTYSINYGSINTDFKIGKKEYHTPAGIAHYLEHIKFNIDSNLTAHEMFSELGCETNAFTSFNVTNYQVIGNKDAVDNTLRLLDFVQNPYFTKKLINKERGIIVSEANLVYDNPYILCMYGMFKNFFKREECTKFITGAPEDVKRITLDDITNVFNAYYHPANCSLVITGNFNPYEMLAAIKENQSKKEFGSYLNPVRIKKTEPRKIINDYEEIEGNVNSYKIKVAVKIAINDFKDLSFLELLLYTRMVLKINFGTCSDFKNELLDKELVYSINSSVNELDGFLLFQINADTEYKEETLNRIYNQLDNMVLDEKSFTRALNANIATMILDYEDIEIVNDNIQNELLYQDEIIPNKKEIIENTTYEDILNFMKKVDFKNRTTFVMCPKDK